MYINVLELLEENVRDNPDKTALSDINESMSYYEVQNAAMKIAAVISSAMDQTEIPKPIAVCIDRNIRSIVLFFGIVYSGNFYVPIDTNMPKERIRMILDDLKPAMILSSDHQSIEGTEVVDYEKLLEMAGNPDEKTARELIGNVRKTHIDIDPLYTIYTSGSTGKPKGVTVSHASVIDLIEQFNESFRFPDAPVFGNQAPFDFDVSVKDIYNSLYQHGTVVVIPKSFFAMPYKLIEYINSMEINVLIWAVSAMRIVENFKTFASIATQYPKLIMFSGEVMPVKVLNYWRENISDATYVNLYGPTEITCNCSYYIVDREFEPDESIPVGVPFKNAQILLLDEDNKPVMKPDMEGEICVRGRCLALGYYGDKAKTSTAFSQNPTNDRYPDRVYHTGDMGYYDADGLLRFTSRKDYQIKHMGHRIELGEIETIVNSVEYIDAAVCVFDGVNEKIVLFYQTGKGAEGFETDRELERDIVARLGRKLPKFMWPNVYRRMDALPLNKNGKIDRVELAKSV